MALKYSSYKTEAMKMVYLHKVASKAFTLDFTTAEDGVSDDEKIICQVHNYVVPT